MTTGGGSAGTAGSGFRTDAAEHTWQPTALEPGERPRCRHNCGRGKDQHAKGTK